MDNEGAFGGAMYARGFGKGAVAITLTNNIITGNRAKYGSAIMSDSGQTSAVNDEPDGSTTWSLANNTITGNAATTGNAIHLDSGTIYGDGGITSLLMRNDIVWGNTNPRQGLQINVVVEPGRAGVAKAYVSYSDVGSIGTWGAGAYTVNNVINKPPLFVGLANRDFRLQDNSPCIDSGDPSSAYNDGKRPPAKGTERNDMGAYGGLKNHDWP